MSQTPIQRLASLASKAADLHERAARGEVMTARDLALTIEYNQQYADILDELEHSVKASTKVICTVNGKTIQFKNDSDFANWLAEKMT